MRRVLILMVGLIGGSVAAQTGPGGVGNSTTNRLWLRADSAVVHSGGVVSQWNDISGNGLALSQVTGSAQPTLVDGVINSLPGIRFDGVSDYLETSYNASLNSVSHTVLLVTRVTGGASSSRVALYSADSAAGLGYLLQATSGNVWQYQTGSFGGFNTYDGGSAIANQWEIFAGYPLDFYQNGTYISSGSNWGQNTSKPFVLGRNEGLPNFFNGDIAEVIVYNTSLSASQRVLVENYLSSKYNLPIADDRYDYESTHGNDVAGIANLGGGSHIQAFSSSFACSTFGVSTNGSALYGHNGANLKAIDKVNVPPTIARRLTRVWRMDTTNVGILQTAFLFKTAGLVIGDSSKLRLLSDHDGDFSDARVISGSYFSGQFQTTLITLDGTTGTYFTLASTDESNFSPIVVSNTNPSGIGSLSEAIALANAVAGPDTIVFTIAAGSTINTSVSFNLTDAGTTINGDLDSDGIPDITVNGTGITGGPTFNITSADNTIRGLVLQGNPAFPAITIFGSTARNNSVLGNYIGLTAAGTARFSNYIGVRIESGARQNRIGDGTALGRNVISGNALYGIEISGSDSNRALGNYVGLNAAGDDSIGNAGVGIMVSQNSSHNWIGDGTAGGRNVVSGNYDDGVRIRDFGSDSNSVLGNYLGTDATGTTGFGNPNGEGCAFSDTANYNRLGDGTAGGRNVIAGHGNGRRGFVLNSVSYCTVKGNYIGLSATGTDTIPNGLGALIDKASRNTIGGNFSADMNFFTGNALGGLALTASSGGGDNLIVGNRIGTSPGGFPFGNGGGSGVIIVSNSSRDSLRDNLIAYHKSFGITIDGASTDSNVIFRNSIFRNDSGGVQITNGAQQGVRRPTISSVSLDSIVSGTASPFALVHVYNDSTDQGQYFIDTLVADVSGNWSKKLNLIPGLNVTALQDSGQNTSVFSIAINGIPLPGTLVTDMDSIVFPSVQVGDTITRPLNIYANGGPVFLSQISLGMTQGFEILNMPALPYTLNPSLNDTIRLTVRWVPMETGFKRDTIRFVSNALNNAGFYISVSGQVALPGMLASVPGSIFFSSIRVGDSLTASLNVYSMGGSVQISQIIHNPDTTQGFEIFNIPTLPLVIDSAFNDTVRLTVRWRPTKQGINQDTVRFVSDAVNGASFFIALRGLALENVPPVLTSGILRSTVLTQYLDVYLLSDESLLSVMGTADSADTLDVQPVPNTERKLFSAPYKLVSTDTVTFHFTASDSAGNVSVLDRTYDVISLPKGPVSWKNDVITLSRARSGSEGFVLIGNKSIPAKDRPAKWQPIGPAVEIMGTPVFESEPVWTIEMPIDAGGLNVSKVGLYQRTDNGWTLIGRTTGNTASGKLIKWGDVAVFYNPDLVEIPRSLQLAQNYPNPFNPTTTIRFGLPHDGHVKLTVYNILGQRIVDLLNEDRSAGFHAVSWNGRNAFGVAVASGIYLYRLETTLGIQTRKMILLK